MAWRQSRIAAHRDLRIIRHSRGDNDDTRPSCARGGTAIQIPQVRIVDPVEVQDRRAADPTGQCSEAERGCGLPEEPPRQIRRIPDVVDEHVPEFVHRERLGSGGWTRPAATLDGAPRPFLLRRSSSPESLVGVGEKALTSSHEMSVTVRVDQEDLQGRAARDDEPKHNAARQQFDGIQERRECT
jgi:hypothetical protein